MGKQKNKKQNKNGTITIKNGLFGSSIFSSTMGEVSNSKLHAVTAFRINNLMKIVKAKAQDYQEIRVRLCKELGEETEDKKGYSFPDEKNRDKFEKEMDELDNLDIKIDVEKIKFPTSIELTSIQAGLIEDLFTFDES